jgi:GNAT superfamily N-acetyltransferase
MGKQKYNFSNLGQLFCFHPPALVSSNKVNMKFIKTEPNTTINSYRHKLYDNLVAPIDGMWEALQIGGAQTQTYLIEHECRSIGFCCVDDSDRSLNQIYLEDSMGYLMSSTIEALVNEEVINAATLGTNDPMPFNACLSRAKSVDADTYLYRYVPGQIPKVGNDKALTFCPAEGQNVDELKLFFKSQAGFDDQIGYGENLIERGEIFFFRLKGENTAGKVVATGECRLSDTQPKYADIGVIVNSEHRGKGVGAIVLHEMAKLAISKGRIPICSTTRDNVAAQKAIERSGFCCFHIIYKMSL